jgi:hypothetical protein
MENATENKPSVPPASQTTTTGHSDDPVAPAPATSKVISEPLVSPQQAAVASRSLTKNVPVNNIAAVEQEMLLSRQMQRDTALLQMQRRKMEMAHQLRLAMLERLSPDQILSLFAKDMIMRAQAHLTVTPVPKRMQAQQGSPPDTKRARIDPR